jgi:hypothetical protein
VEDHVALLRVLRVQRPRRADAVSISAASFDHTNESSSHINADCVSLIVAQVSCGSGADRHCW